MDEKKGMRCAYEGQLGERDSISLTRIGMGKVRVGYLDVVFCLGGGFGVRCGEEEVAGEEGGVVS